MIHIEGISKSFRSEFLRRRRRVLVDPSLDIRAGETYALLGANGAGKTTAMKILLGLIRADAGRASIAGTSVEEPRARARLGYLPEHPYFFPHLTGEEIVRYYGRLSGLGRAEAARRAESLLARVRLSKAAGGRIRTYSKGMLQRLGFAQALVASPDLLILDEPLSGLDPVGRKEMRDLLAELKTEGTTVLLTSHILEDVERLCDRAGFLAEGRIRAEVKAEGRTWIEVLTEGLDPESIRAGDLVADRIVREGEGILIALGSERDLPRVRNEVRSRGGRIVGVTKRRESLEDLFVENVLSRPGGRDAD